MRTTASHWRALAAAALMAAAALTAWAQGSERPIRVGAVSALTGQAGFPESSRAAARYFDAINAAGGVNGRRKPRQRKPCYPFPYWRVRATCGLYAVGPRGGFPTQTPGL